MKKAYLVAMPTIKDNDMFAKEYASKVADTIKPFEGKFLVRTPNKLIKDRKEKFPSSGEINFTISQPKKIFEKVLKYYDGQYLSYDNFDGLSLVFKNWRFNLRSSNTEPLVRLNVETKNGSEFLNQCVTELTEIMVN